MMRAAEEENECHEDTKRGIEDDRV
jgi:hypothetical protein